MHAKIAGAKTHNGHDAQDDDDFCGDVFELLATQ
jgi:hypothetical protein